ncbi:MAG TPA: flippase activity-associated protein Agl23, partial [Anaerolineales bacterium]|nr:flippase activity-associated protein Agl23 [Anaerolineales bacterium]
MATVEAAVQKPEGWLERLLGQGISVRTETIVYAALLLAAAATRFYDLETRAMSHDESLHTYYSWELFKGRGFQHTPLMHGPLQFHLVALSYFLFGDSDASARVPAALSGVLAVGMLFFYRRWLGRTGALVAAALLLISPYMLYYSRYVRNEMFVVLEVLLCYWATFRYFETRQPRWLVLMAFAWSLHSMSKETYFIYAAQALIFFGAYLAWQLFRRKWANETLRILFLVGLVVTVIGSGLGMVSYFQGRAAGEGAGTEELAPLDPEAAVAPTAVLSPLVALGGILGLAGLALVGTALVWEFGRKLRTEFPALDVVLVLGTLTLPQLGAIPANLLGWDPLAYQDPSSFNRTMIVVI